MTDTAVPIVRFRDPLPPHGAVLEVLPQALKYSFKIRKTGTAAFYLSRTDPNVTNNIASILTAQPAMVTIERPDGQLPWVGFVTGYNAKADDPAAFIQCADHSWRLASPGGARTTRSQTYSTASGRIIRDVMHDMEERAEPAPFLGYAGVEDGVPANYTVRADYGFDMLEALAKQTNWEWGLAYDVNQQRVLTQLLWRSRMGADRRDEEIWSEQKHFTTASYSLTYQNGVNAAVVVGGASTNQTFGNRPAAVASKTGKAPDFITNSSVLAKSPISPYGLGGTRIVVTSRVTDLISLRNQAQQLHEAPEFAVEQLSLQLFEDAVDMTRFGLGDIRTVRLQTTPLQPVERTVRVIGIQCNPDTHYIDVEVQVLP